MLSKALPAYATVLSSWRARRLLCALSLLCVLSAAGCASGSGSTGAKAEPSGPDQHQAQAVADHEFGLLSGGGWGAAWDLWTASAQQAISRADFVRLGTQCKPWIGQPFVIKEIGWPAVGRFTVTWQRAGDTGTSLVLYQDGAWRFQPDPATLATYGSPPVAMALSRLREQHACRS